MIWWYWALIATYIVGSLLCLWQWFWDDTSGAGTWIALALLWPAAVALGVIVVPMVWVGEKLDAWRTGLHDKRRKAKWAKEEAARKPPTPDVVSPPPVPTEPQRELLFEHQFSSFNPLLDVEDDMPVEAINRMRLYRDYNRDNARFEVLMECWPKGIVLPPEALRIIGEGFIRSAQKLEQKEPYR